MQCLHWEWRETSISGLDEEMKWRKCSDSTLVCQIVGVFEHVLGTQSPMGYIQQLCIPYLCLYSLDCVVIGVCSSQESRANFVCLCLSVYILENILVGAWFTYFTL